MKTKSIHLILALLTGAVATAQEGQERRPPPIPPLLAIFDADHDGELSAAEMQNAAKALGKLDKNGDGKITKDEMAPPRPEGRADAPGGDGPQGPPQGQKPPPLRVPPVVMALDTDKNGTISAEELKNAPESLKQLDTNGDGELSPEELHPQGPPPPPDGGQENGRPQGPPPQGPGAEVE